jgi:hypothetical protein
VVKTSLGRNPFLPVILSKIVSGYHNQFENDFARMGVIIKNTPQRGIKNCQERLAVNY